MSAADDHPRAGLARLKSVESALQDLRRDARITWGYGGPSQVWEALLGCVAHRIYRRERCVLFEQELDSVSDCPPPPGVEIQPLADRDWELLVEALTTRALGRMRRNTGGAVCFVAWRGDRPVGYAQQSEPGATPRALPVPLPPDAVYGWGTWVDPRERGRGMGSALISARLRHARERGFRRGWRIIATDNRPALRTLGKSSGGAARVVGRVTYATFLGRTRVHFRPGAGVD